MKDWDFLYPETVDILWIIADFAGNVGYAYDDYDRLTGVKYDGESSDRYAYEYGANGQACVVRDNNLGRVLQTEHDLVDRPMGTQLRDTNGNLLYRTELDYDKQNRLVGFGESAGNQNYKTGYTYDNDNRVTKLTYDGTAAVSYAYDELGRISTRTVGKLTSTYAYVAGGHGTNSTTPLVASIAQNAIPFTYAYDNRGNIISETRSGVTTTYSYDALGQLIRVNDPVQNQTWVFNYDRGGNIVSRVRYAYTTGTVGTVLETIPYTYGDSNWKDKLTAYNGKTITYDAIGNPTNDDVWSYEWQAGRQLKRMSAEGTALTFKYDHNGLRTQKVVEQSWYPETTNYYLHGKLLTHMTVDYTDFDEVVHTDKLHFFYDAQSRPAQVNFNGVLYTYIHNLQGDIVGLLDSTGALVVEYKYDAWGKPISTTGNLADTLGKRNPFRYRGYIYDEETGLYYLRSRYYNPEIGRFVQMDRTIVHKQMRNVILNVFAYAMNAPIVACDVGGEDAVFITDTSSFTHSSLLVQDENNDWYYFYWGASKEGSSSGAFSNMSSNSSFSAGAGNVCVIYEKIELDIEGLSESEILDQLNVVLAEDVQSDTTKFHYSGTYEKALYLKGDFTAAHTTAIEYKNNASKLVYDILSKNCAHAALALLKCSYEKQKNQQAVKVISYASRRIVPVNIHRYLVRNSKMLTK